MKNFDFHIENFMLYCTSKNLAKKTLMSYEQSLKLFGMFLEDEFSITEIEKVQSGHVRHYIKHLKERGKYTVVSRKDSKAINYPDHRTDFQKPISTTTIANYVRNIKVFFNYLYEIENEISKNPCKKIENPKPERKKKKLLTERDLVKVLRQFDVTTFHGLRNYLVSKLLLDTGTRIGEALSIKPEHIDFNHKSILIVNPKNKQERYVWFSIKFSRDLKKWFKYRDRYSDSEYLFPTIKGTQLQVRNFEKALRDAGKAVEVDIHPHQLRNNFAKHYLLNGGDIASLSRILGHSSPEVTEKAYLDFTDEEIGKKYQRHSPLNNMDI